MIDGALAARTPADRRRDGRTFSVRPADGRAPRSGHHAERHPPDPARESRALTPAAGLLMDALRDRPRRPDPPRRRVRRPHRPRARAGASASCPTATPTSVTSAGNAAGTGARIALLDRAARDRDRGRRPPRREDRDRRRAALPGALRRRDGASRTTPSPYPRLATVVPLRRAQLGGRPRGRAPLAPRPRRPTRSRGAPHDATTTERAGGVAAAPRRQAAPRASRRRSRPVHHPHARRRSRCSTRRASRSIEQNADTILEQVGIDFRGDPEALTAASATAGADVDGERVRFPRGIARQHRSRRRRPRAVHPVRAEPGAQRRDRRHAHGLAPALRLAVRARPRQAAAATARSRTSATS